MSSLSGLLLLLASSLWFILIIVLVKALARRWGVGGRGLVAAATLSGVVIAAAGLGVSAAGAGSHGAGPAGRPAALTVFSRRAACPDQHEHHKHHKHHKHKHHKHKSSPDEDSPSGTSSSSASPGSSPAPSASTPSAGGGTSTVPAGSAKAGPRGIYAFSGGSTSDLASDPDVAGRSLVYYWAQLEPEPGVFRWDIIDRDIAPWAAAGKKVILRVSTAGWASWDRAAGSAHGTPAWVYAHGVRSVTEQDGAVLPQYWNPVFQRDLSAFLHAFGARYDGNPHVALIDAAVGIGGETKPDSEKNPGLLSLWQSIGYTDPIWWSYVQQSLTSYMSSFRKTPIAVMPDKTFIGGTSGYNEHLLLSYAVSKGLWLQDNGLVPDRTLPAPWGQTPVISEQRGPTSQTGDSLSADLQAALADHARIILVFTSDLTPANRAVIHQAATQLQPPARA